MSRSLVVLLCGLVWESGALAQAPAPAEKENQQAAGPPGAGAAGQPPVAAPIADPQDPTWQAYDRAVEELAGGNVEQARAMFARLAREKPEHPAGSRAARLLTLLTRRGGPQRPEPSATAVALLRSDAGLAARLRDEKPSRIARAELTLLQTVHGIGLGIEVCLLLQCGDSVRAWVSTLLAGAGGGMSLSLVLTERGIKPGHALALDSGTIWGFWNGLALVASTDIAGVREGAGTLALAQLGGLGAGELLYRLFEPSAGQVALAGTTGLWSGVGVALVHGMTGFTASSRKIWQSLLIASDAGLAAGALLGRHYPMSHSRTLLIDAGGILGLLAGMGADLMIQGGDVSRKPFFSLALGGTALGLGLTTYLTRHWDLPELPAQLSVAPVPGGVVAGVRLSLP